MAAIAFDLRALCIFLLVSLLLLVILRRHLSTSDSRSVVERQKTSSSYVSGFAYPKVKPCMEDLSQIKPIPYRPFRWGDYHVTMGIRPMDWDSWIELDQDFTRYHQIRDYRIRSRGNKLVKTLDAQPGIVDSGHAAAKELMYELAEFLSRRYPTAFIVTRHKSSPGLEQGWDGLGLIHTVTIVLVNRILDLDVEDPMTVSALLVQDDLALMVEGSDGRYYLQAGAVVIPGSWRFEDKAGMPLDEIHTSGHVPFYREKLQLSLGRFFKRLPVDKPVIRNNYTFQIVAPPTQDPSIDKMVDPEELSWATSMLGDEDRSQTGHTSIGHWDDASRPPLTPETMKLRTERQTLRRLPKSRAIVFTFRTYVTSVEQLVQEPGVPGRLASAVRSWPEPVAHYKARGLFERDLLDYLDQWHRKQVEENIDKVELNYPL